MATGHGLYKAVQKVGENTYKIKLLRDIQISTTLNIEDLTPYVEDDEDDNEDLRTNPFQGGGLVWSMFRAWANSH